MTDKVKLLAIRAEIERLYRNHVAMDSLEGISTTKQLSHLLTFIDSLPEETKNNDLEVEILNYNNSLNLNIDTDYSWDDIEANVVLAARHFAEWGKKQTLYPVSQDFEVEFNRFLDDMEGVPRMLHSDEQMEWGKDIARHFANWQRELMMKDAIEATVIKDEDNFLRGIDKNAVEKALEQCNNKDKVKIIILKEE